MKLTRYDQLTLSIIAGLSIFVLGFMYVGRYAVGFPFETYWYLPIGWFIGATMAWGYNKATNNMKLK